MVVTVALTVQIFPSNVRQFQATFSKFALEMMKLWKPLFLKWIINKSPSSGTCCLFWDLVVWQQSLGTTSHEAIREAAAELRALTLSAADHQHVGGTWTEPEVQDRQSPPPLILLLLLECLITFHRPARSRGPRPFSSVRPSVRLVASLSSAVME